MTMMPDRIAGRPELHDGRFEAERGEVCDLVRSPRRGPVQQTNPVLLYRICFATWTNSRAPNVSSFQQGFYLTYSGQAA